MTGIWREITRNVRSVVRWNVPISTVCLLILLLASSCAAQSDLERVQKKLDAIELGRIKPGYRVTFTEAEVNAWVLDRVSHKFEGVRNPKVQLGAGTLTASAVIDFLKIRKAEGLETMQSIAKLIEVERPVRVDLRVESSAGHATVTPVRLDIAGVAITGSVLDFLVTKFAGPWLPEATVGHAFELREGIDRVEIRQGALRVIMKP